MGVILCTLVGPTFKRLVDRIIFSLHPFTLYILLLLCVLLYPLLIMRYLFVLHNIYDRYCSVVRPSQVFGEKLLKL